MVAASIRSARARINDYIEQKERSARDIPMAIAIHECLGLLILASTWFAAYNYPPSKIPILAGPIKRMEAILPARLKSMTSNNPVLASRAGQSYVEASCVRKLIRPATIPLKLTATFLILKSGVFGSLSAPEKKKKQGACGPTMCSAYAGKKIRTTSRTLDETSSMPLY